MDRVAVFCSVVVLAVSGGYLAGQHEGVKGFAVLTPHDLKWTDPPAVLPPGAKVAILEGDPGKEGPFVMRVHLPDGYRIPPHTHPKPERITVISGTFNVAMGGTFDKSKAKAMPAGTYGTWPAGMKHYVWAKGETVIQLHGVGPWTLVYVNPKDDPRNKGGKGGASLDALRGTWELTGTADAKRSDPGTIQTTMTISADGRVVLRAGELVTNQGTVKVSQAGSAHHIDMQLTTRLVQGIYEAHGDRLVICCDEPGNARPVGLTPTGTQWVEWWVRATH